MGTEPLLPRPPPGDTRFDISSQKNPPKKHSPCSSGATRAQILPFVLKSLPSAGSLGYLLGSVYMYGCLRVPVSTHTLSQSTAGLRAEQPEPTPPGAWLGAGGGPWWPLVAFGPSVSTASIRARAQGSRLPRGMNYRAIKRARLSRRVLCSPSIRRHKQLHSRQKSGQKRARGDPGGGLLRGSAGGTELGTPRAPTIEGSHPCPSRRSPKAPRPEAGAAHSHAPNAARSQISPP